MSESAKKRLAGGSIAVAPQVPQPNEITSRVDRGRKEAERAAERAERVNHGKPLVGLTPASVETLPDGTVHETFTNGSEEWTKYGVLHRTDGPAQILHTEDFHEETYCIQGVVHRTDGPARITTDADGTTEEWYRNGLVHRDDGPARTTPRYTEWCRYGETHRDGGPAVEYVDGSQSWYQHDELDRTDGPAIEFADGTSEYWRKGNRLGPIRSALTRLRAGS